LCAGSQHSSQCSSEYDLPLSGIHTLQFNVLQLMLVFYSAVKEGAGNTCISLQTGMFIACQFYKLSELVRSDLWLSDKIISIRIFASVKLLL